MNISSSISRNASRQDWTTKRIWRSWQTRGWSGFSRLKERKTKSSKLWNKSVSFCDSCACKELRDGKYNCTWKNIIASRRRIHIFSGFMKCSLITKARRCSDGAVRKQVSKVIGEPTGWTGKEGSMMHSKQKTGRWRTSCQETSTPTTTWKCWRGLWSTVPGPVLFWRIKTCVGLF